MNKQTIEIKLSEIGLTEDEIKIYLFLLEQGAKAVLNLSRELNIDRSKIYRICESLLKKKLLETSSQQWGQTYSASSPEQIKTIIYEEEQKLESKKNDLDELITSLSNLQGVTKGLFDIRFYKGVEGIKQMLWNDLNSKELLVLGPQDLNDLVGKTFAEKLRTESSLRNQKIFELNNVRDESFETQVANYKEKNYKGRYISSEIIPLNNYIEIFNNTVSFTHIEQEEFKGIEIHNRSFAEMLRSMFWHYWELSEEHQAHEVKI